MSEELELKFIVDDLAAAKDWLSRRLGVPTYGSGTDPWRTIQIIDRYFDTPDLALAAAGYGARLRQMGRQTVLTVKSDLEIAGGLHRREELEASATRSLDPLNWPPSDARTRVLDVVGERRLIERFRVEQERHEVEARISGAVVVASLDDADVWTTGRAAGSLKQLEVELRGGDETVLRALGDEIAAAGIGVAESRSKMAVALEMVEAAQKIQPRDSLAAAGRVVLRRQLLRMLEREIAARTGDPLAIKQMRVATRRMRSAWRVFGDGYRRQARRKYVDELRRVAAALGDVRDMDVLREGLPTDAGLGPLAEAWRQRRAEANSRLVTLFHDAGYDKFVGDYLEFTASQAADVAGDGPAQTLADLAPVVLAAGADLLRQSAARALWGLDDAAWHEMRISAKRLRYSIEQLREVIGEHVAADAIARLIRVQDCLGAMNDAFVAAREAEAWLEAHPRARTATKKAVHRYVDAQLDEIARQRREFAPIWQGAANLFTER